MVSAHNKPGNVFSLSADYFVNCLLIFFAALTPGSGESCVLHISSVNIRYLFFVFDKFPVNLVNIYIHF